MVAAHRKIVAVRFGYTAFNLADATPENIRGISVLFVAGHDTAFAADAFRHVEMKAILLARSRRARQLSLCADTAERNR